MVVRSRRQLQPFCLGSSTILPSVAYAFPQSDSINQGVSPLRSGLLSAATETTLGNFLKSKEERIRLFGEQKESGLLACPRGQSTCQKQCIVGNLLACWTLSLGYGQLGDHIVFAGWASL